MELYSEKKAKFTAIRHELVMSIGHDLELGIVLSKFMNCCIRSLALCSAHFYRYPGPERANRLQHYLTLPEDAGTVPQIVDTSRHPGTCSPLQTTEEDFYDLTYSLKGIGFIVLRRRTTAMDQDLIESLNPVIERLSNSCQACLRHEKLVRELHSTKHGNDSGEFDSIPDPLTKLPGRPPLYRYLHKLLEKPTNGSAFGTIYFINIDRFKRVNDTLGHAIADQLLVAVSEILKKSIRAGDFLARMGGDEFALVTCNPSNSECRSRTIARDMAGRIVDAVRQPMQIKDYNFQISVSIGIALFPQHIHGDKDAIFNSEQLLRFADIAMNHAKYQGRDRWEFFKPQMQARNDKRILLEKRLRKALHNDEFQIHYQPMVTPNGRIIGGELLLRWYSPELGSVPPVEFIPIAEETGLIREIGEWTLREACQFIRKMTQGECKNRLKNFQYLSVNVSPKQFKQASFADNVLSIVRQNRINPSHLRLEVTEGVAIDDISDTVRKMQQLQDIGISFSLDDFGTGYSSLSYLHKLPLQTIKIDRSFVTNINERTENQAIVDAIVAMAEHMGKSCTVEGVETLDDLAYFLGVQIHAMQGHCFSPALTEREFTDILQNSVIFDVHTIDKLGKYRFTGL